jgi:hypothetical protein
MGSSACLRPSIRTQIGNYTLSAIGITEYLGNGGKF